MAWPMPRVPPVTSATRVILDFLPFSRSRLNEILGRANAGRGFLLSCSAKCGGPTSIALEAHGNAHAAADAQGGKSPLGVTPLHLKQQRVEHARAGSTDRMPDGDGAAVDVDLVGVPTEPLVDGASLGGERLIGFDQVQVLHGPAGPLQRLLGG